MKPKYKLMASAPTLEELKALMIKKMYWSNVNVLESGEVESSGVLVEGLRVVNKRGRYRLERVVS